LKLSTAYTQNKKAQEEKRKEKKRREEKRKEKKRKEKKRKEKKRKEEKNDEVRKRGKKKKKKKWISLSIGQGSISWMQKSFRADRSRLSVPFRVNWNSTKRKPFVLVVADSSFCSWGRNFQPRIFSAQVKRHEGRMDAGDLSFVKTQKEIIPPKSREVGRGGAGVSLHPLNCGS